ncbi:MAG: RsmB/NOP family class I SAM-dependent RNA methyltransferase [Bacillota bacterium]|nr:RsmB/NOP family class I SAM-dependent RNA methyltransferase [Bacillota bacterium]
MKQEFFDRIQSYIPEEYDAFLQCFEKEMFKGLRVNTKKIDLEMFTKQFPYIGAPSPFCKEGFYIEKNLGNHPYHFAGLYYLQEPSASSAVTILNVQENDIVLDLCSAPGGKSTQIAASLGKEGFLVSNEYDSKRAQILLSNMERLGVMNVLITNSNTKVLCTEFSECFDKVLVDAPCSGEGMIKKHDAAGDNWSVENIEFCAARQKEILQDAYKALRKDGILVYSTCTYAKEENEDVIRWFVENYPDMEVIDPGVSFGREGLDLPFARRIFPMDQGEGHFICKLRKNGGGISSFKTVKSAKLDKYATSFLNEQMEKDDYYYSIQKDKVYMMQAPFIDVKKVKVVRQGTLVGETIKTRFEPSHAFYLNRESKFKNMVDLNVEEMDLFLHGNQISKPCKKGYVAVCVEGHPFGFGKSDGNVIKNKIPKGLRLLEGVHILK